MKEIDLSKETEEFRISFPKCSEYTILEDMDIIVKVPKQDPFDLVPKSYEELMNNVPLFEYTKCEKIPLEYLIDYKNCQTRCINEEDRNAFLALIRLRRLWHEWVKVLGVPENKLTKYDYRLTYNNHENKVVVDVVMAVGGTLLFKEKSHAEKFIECFGDLLEQAKILL